MSHEPGPNPSGEPVSGAERLKLVSAERDARATAETALAALAKIEARYRSIAETTTEWVWACDVEGRHTYSNPAVMSIPRLPAGRGARGRLLRPDASG